VHRDDSTLPEALDEALLRAGFAQGDEATQLIRSNLRASSARHRVLALRGGARHSLLTNDDWLSALQDNDLDVRREALTLIAYEKISSSDIFNQIIEALDDPDPLVVDGAAFALGEQLYVAAVDPLCLVAQSHDDARCREAAVAALGAIGDDRGRAAVLGALEDKPPVRRHAIVALSNFEGPDIEAALARASEDRDWQVRAAVNQLARENDD
jgi:HEAT repeat protein